MSMYEAEGEIADGMTASELAEYDRDTEYRLDAEQELRQAEDERAQQERDAQEVIPDVCTPELIDGTLYGCGDCEDCDDQDMADESAE